MSRKTVTTNLPVMSRREREVFVLRRQNFTYAKIGATLGISEAAAEQAFKRALRACPAPDVEELRTEILIECWTQMEAIRGRLADCKSNEAYANLQNSLIRWAERAAALVGADAPQRHRIDVIDVAQIMEILADRRAQIAALQRDPISRPAVVAQVGAGPSD